MTKERVQIWTAPRFSPDGKKGVSLHQNANEVILQVTTEQGFATVVLEPERDLATLVEAVQILVAQVVSGQRSKGAKKTSR